MTMGTLSEVLGKALATPVVDDSGLSETFDLTLKWNGPARGFDGSPNPQLVKALRAQGLDLGRAKRPIDALVIANAEKPEEDR